MSRVLYILLFLVSVTPSLAQSEPDCSYNLSGQVIDEHDQSALSFATVFVVELSQGVVANAQGNYLLENLCKGVYTIVVSHVSCQPDTFICTGIKGYEKNVIA